ncbi:MAG: hypothetical protein WCL08_06060 [Verrucomicrobiota bacterium]
MKLFFPILLLTLPACQGTFLGLDRAQRFNIYGNVLDLAGHPEFGEPLKLVAKTMAKNPVKPVLP